MNNSNSLLQISRFFMSQFQSMCISRNLSISSKLSHQGVFQVGKGVDKAVCCHPAYLTNMQSTS